MNLDRLQLFVEIIDRGSLSAAAREVHLSQPAASRALARLEEEFGVELFDRVGRGLELNAAGRVFLPRAREILAAIETIHDEVSEIAERGIYDLTVGTVDSLGTFVLPGAITELRRQFDEIPIKVRTMRTTDLLARLGDDIDLAVVAWSGEPEGWQSSFIAHYDMRFYGLADRFADLADVSDESELRRFPLVQIEPKPGQPTLVDDEMPSFALTQSLASVKALIMQGFGVGALLNYMLDDDERSRLTVAGVPHDPDCALYLLRAPRFSGAVHDEIVVALRDALREVLIARAPS